MISKDLLRIACGLTTDLPLEESVPVDTTCGAIENIVSQKLGKEAKLYVIKSASSQSDLDSLLKGPNAFLLTGNIKKEAPNKIRFNIEFISQQLRVVDEFDIEGTIQDVRQKYHLGVSDFICIERGKILNDIKLKDIATHSNTLYIASDFGQPTLVMRNVKTRDGKDHIVFVREDGTLKDLATQFASVYGIPAGKNPVFVYTDPVTMKAERLYFTCEINRINPNGRLVISFGTPSTATTSPKAATPQESKATTPKRTAPSKPQSQPLEAEKPKQETFLLDYTVASLSNKNYKDHVPIDIKMCDLEAFIAKRHPEIKGPQMFACGSQIQAKDDRLAKDALSRFTTVTLLPERIRKEEPKKEEIKKEEQKKEEQKKEENDPIAEELITIKFVVDKDKEPSELQVKKGITFAQLLERLKEENDRFRGKEFRITLGFTSINELDTPLYKHKSFHNIDKKPIRFTTKEGQTAPANAEFFLTFVAGSVRKKLVLNPKDTWEKVRAIVMREYDISSNNIIHLIVKGEEVVYSETVAEKNIDCGYEVHFSVEETASTTYNETSSDPVKDIMEVTGCDANKAAQYLNAYGTAQDATVAILDGKPPELESSIESKAESLMGASGCTKEQAMAALQQAGGNPNMAFDIILGNAPIQQQQQVPINNDHIDIFIDNLIKAIKESDEPNPEEKIKMILAIPEKILESNNLSIPVEVFHKRAVERGLITQDEINLFREAIGQNIDLDGAMNGLTEEQKKLVKQALKENPSLDAEMIIAMLESVDYNYEAFANAVKGL